MSDAPPPTPGPAADQILRQNMGMVESIDSGSPNDRTEPSNLLGQVSPPVPPKPEPPPKEHIPPAIDDTPVSHMFPFSTPRIFLDLCSGVSSPLSQALQNFKCDTLAFDILIHQNYDLLQDDMYERLLRLCACGIIAHAAAAPACKESGGHSHLEQPASAMSWEEPFVQQFLLECQCSCINLAACKFGENWLKHGCSQPLFQSYRHWHAHVIIAQMPTSRLLVKWTHLANI